MADLLTDLKLIVMFITIILMAVWVYKETEKTSWVAAIIATIVLGYLIFQHEELAIGAFIFFFVIQYVWKPFGEGLGKIVEIK